MHFSFLVSSLALAATTSAYFVEPRNENSILSARYAETLPYTHLYSHDVDHNNYARDVFQIIYPRDFYDSIYAGRQLRRALISTSFARPESTGESYSPSSSESTLSPQSVPSSNLPSTAGSNRPQDPPPDAFETPGHSPSAPRVVSSQRVPQGPQTANPRLQTSQDYSPPNTPSPWNRQHVADSLVTPPPVERVNQPQPVAPASAQPPPQKGPATATGPASGQAPPDPTGKIQQQQPESGPSIASRRGQQGPTPLDLSLPEKPKPKLPQAPAVYHLISTPQGTQTGP